MRLSTLLKLQICYGICGILYNLVSYVLLTVSGQALSPTKPVLGALTMLAYGFLLIPGFLGYLKLYRLIMILPIIVLGSGGIIVHLINLNHPVGYYSLESLYAAVIINSFGLLLNLYGLFGRYHPDTRQHIPSK